VRVTKNRRPFILL